MMLSANTVTCSSEPPLNRLSMAYRSAAAPWWPAARPEQYRTFAVEMPGAGSVGSGSAGAGAGGAERGGEVPGGGGGGGAGGGLALEVEQRVAAARLERPAAPVVELGHDRGHDAVVAGDRAQVMGEEAAADDEHALVPQRRQLAADLHEPDRVQARHRDLEHGHVRGRVHLHQRDVRAVVKAPAGDVEHRGGRGAQQLADLRGQSGRAGRLVSDLG